MESLLIEKQALRHYLKKLRDGISISRREEAQLALKQFFPHLLPFKRVLSFVSFRSEIESQWINHALANSFKLFLPKISANELKIFQVNDLQKELILHSFGHLEPNPQTCIELEASDLEAILVPALGFDLQHHRLGYGKGFYDRLLSKIPHVPAFGLGFREQLISQLPISATDISLHKVCLF